MRRFSLYRRGKIWYVQLYNPQTRRYLSGRSTGETTRNAAVMVVSEWLRDGLPDLEHNGPRAIADVLEVNSILNALRSTPLTPGDAERIVSVLKARELIETAVVKAGPGSEGFVAFLGRFWSHDQSPYVKEKLAHGHRIGRRHCYDMALAVGNYWAPFFADKRLSEIRRGDLKTFSLWLSEEKNLKGKTINNVLSAGTVPLRWARVNELIPTNPAEGLVKFSGSPAKRGVFTEQEAARLFSVPWPDERSRLGNILAMTCGLRAGEVLAVQVRDIDTDRLQVRHSWSDQDRLKSPKTGSERTIPLLQPVREALLTIARQNPHGVGPTSFVFWSVDSDDRPMDSHCLLDGLHDAQLHLSLTGEEERKNPEKIAEAREYWRTRRVVFHSWRHFYAARMADHLESRKVMLATGHANGAVFEAYADHATAEVFEEVRTAAAETFGRLLPFKKAE
jgi:integrase